MKRLYLAVIFIILANLSYSQNLNLKLIDLSTNMTFVDIDDVMTDVYGFTIFERKGIKQYINVYNNDFDTGVVIKVIDFDLHSKNGLDITLSKGYSIRKIRDDLVQEGYLYVGTNESGFTAYKKDNVIFLIANEPNGDGKIQIGVFYGRQ